MSISRKLMLAGGGEGDYVDDVFSNYRYTGKGGNNIIQQTAVLTSVAGITTVQFIHGGSKLFLFGNAEFATVDLTVPYDLTTIVDNATPTAHSYYRVELAGDNAQYAYSCSGTVVTEWTLSTPGDMSTATATGNTFDITSSGDFRRITVSPDGTHLLVAAAVGAGPDYIHQLKMSTPFDLSTATQSDLLLNGSGQDNVFQAVYNGDGTTLYATQYSKAGEYTLSTPYDVTTATYVGATTPVTSGYMTYFAWADDGYSYVYETSSNWIVKSIVATPYTLDLAPGDYIENGLDMSGKGGLTWISSLDITTDHLWYDTERGATKSIASNLDAAEVTDATGLSAFNSKGFVLEGSLNGVGYNGAPFSSWSFNKREGFFDIVTYTGDGTNGRQIPHNLGSTPGMVVCKRTDGVSTWAVKHRSSPTNEGQLNTPAVFAGYGNFPSSYSGFTDSVFTVDAGGSTNILNQEYVAYIFAHDAKEFGAASDESIINCGSYTGTGTDDNAIDLGWEPQWVMVKNIDDGAQPWYLHNIMLGLGGYGQINYKMSANNIGVNYAASTAIQVTTTGLNLNGALVGHNKAGNNYIYMAIRRPHKPARKFQPEELYSSVEGANGDIFQHKFPVDLGLNRNLTSGSSGGTLTSRVLPTKLLYTSASNAEGVTANYYTTKDQDGYGVSANWAGFNSWGFRRAPGFLDVITYKGGTNTIPHGLGAVPEMVWVKTTSDVDHWPVYHSALGDQGFIRLSVDNKESVWASMFPTRPTETDLHLGGSTSVSYAGRDYAAFLWASVPGFCDIGSYTGTGADVNVDCGFTNGARFVLVKRIDEDGNWYFWDTLRGIVAGNDPYLILNYANAQVTDTDYIDPLASGFTITAAAAASVELNASGGKYIYMAIA